MKIKTLERSVVDKLTGALAGADTKKKWVLTNPNAPCLVGSAIRDVMTILNVINKAESK